MVLIRNFIANAPFINLYTISRGLFEDEDFSSTETSFLSACLFRYLLSGMLRSCEKVRVQQADLEAVWKKKKGSRNLSKCNTNHGDTNDILSINNSLRKTS